MSTTTHGDPDAELSLSFANTWSHRLDAATDRLGGYGDLVEWAVRAGLLADGETKWLREEARNRPAEAAAIVRRARSLGESVYRSLERAAARREPSEQELEILNRELGAALDRLRLDGSGSGCCWTWTGAGEALDRMLWPVVRSAARVLTGDTVKRIRQCASEDCSWLFVDTSRNGRRRWCDMASCGNRAKARRYYARHRNR